MVKRFCDLCKKEIPKGGWYNLNVDYRTDVSVHPGWLVIKDICEDCHSKIYETIANLKYDDNKDDNEIVCEE